MSAVRRLEDIGKRYYEFRAALMIEHNEGLTATYNRFHDPEERASGIQRLRDLHEGNGSRGARCVRVDRCADAV